MTTSTLNPRSLLTTLTDLRNALTIDAVVTGANGVVYVAAAGALDDLLGMPTGFLRAIGAFLIVYAIAVGAIGAPRSISRPLTYGVIAANAAWAVASIVAVVVGWHSPTVAGSIWTVMQAVVVAGFAELQLTALRRTR